MPRVPVCVCSRSFLRQQRAAWRSLHLPVLPEHSPSRVQQALAEQGCCTVRMLSTPVHLQQALAEVQHSGAILHTQHSFYHAQASGSGSCTHWSWLRGSAGAPTSHAGHTCLLPAGCCPAIATLRVCASVCRRWPGAVLWRPLWACMSVSTGSWHSCSQ